MVTDPVSPSALPPQLPQNPSMRSLPRCRELNRQPLPTFRGNFSSFESVRAPSQCRNVRCLSQCWQLAQRRCPTPGVKIPPFARSPLSEPLPSVLRCLSNSRQIARQRFPRQGQTLLLRLRSASQFLLHAPAVCAVPYQQFAACPAAPTSGATSPPSLR